MKYFELENFKLFKDKNGFELAPLTILTGKNSSGKSSLLKSMMILSDYIHSNDQTKLTLDGEFASKHKITKLSNIFNWNTKNKTFSFGYQNKISKIHLQFYGNSEDNHAILRKFTIKLALHNEYLILNNLFGSSWELQFTQGFFVELENSQSPYYPDNDLNPSGREIVDALTIDTIKLKLKFLRRKIRDCKLKENSQDELLHLETYKSFYTNEYQLLKNIHPKEKVTIVLQTEIEKEDVYKSTLGGLIKQILLNFMHIDNINVEADEPQLKKLEVLYKRFVSSKYIFNQSLQGLNLNLQRCLAFELHFLGTNRFYPSNFYEPNLSTSSEIYSVLKGYSENLPKNDGRIFHFINRWLRKFDIATNYLVDATSTPPLIFLELNIDKNKGDGKYLGLKFKHKPTDLGYGAGQLLTILLKFASINLSDYKIESSKKSKLTGTFGGLIVTDSTRIKNKILLIEEPESNLHPDFQVLLCDMLYEAAIIFDLTIIIETHSEYLIRKTQLKVKESQDVNMFKIHYLSNGSHYEMKYLANGRFENEFGEGFLDVASKHVLELL